MRICVFGSSSRDLDALYIDAAYELGRTLGERGHGLVFGGYDVGLMGAVMALVALTVRLQRRRLTSPQ